MSNTAIRPTHRILLFVANTDWYLLNFRLNLLRAARDAGWIVALACPRRDHTEMLEKEGFRVHHIPFDTVGLKPWQEVQTMLSLRRLFRQLRPDVIHLFTLKCVLYGCLVSPARRNIEVIGAVTGMGHLFTTKSWRTRLLKPSVLAALRLAIRRSNARIIFQNDADRDEFVANCLVTADRTTVIRGSGVDCTHFLPRDDRNQTGTAPRLLFCGRLIEEKGIYEYLEATESLTKQGYVFESWIAGAPYPGNPSSLSTEQVEQLARDDAHTVLGHHDNMAQVFPLADIVVLPTYREGTPKALLEAAACGCIIVASDIPGCQGIIDQDRNGILVPSRDSEAIASAIRQIFEKTLDERRAMAESSRAIALERFSDRKVNFETLALYNLPHAR